MNLAFSTGAVLMGALAASSQAQTFTKPQPTTKPGTQVITVPGGSFLGGGDDCAAPDAIIGAGTFNFDNTVATTGTEGQNESNCYFFGSSGVDADVWFSWTSDFTGVATMSMCGGATNDTKIAAYPGGGCPTDGTSLACNDDTCGLQSEIQFSATTGTSYMLQVGSFPGGSTGAGTFTISAPAAGPPNDTCATPTAIAGAGSFAYDTTAATTGVEGQSETLCYDFGTSGIDADVWYEWTASATGSATVSMCLGGSGDTKIAAYPGGGCPSNGTSLACNDDTCGLLSEITFSTVAGSSYMLQIGTFPGGAPSAGTFDITETGPPTIGTNYCTAAANSISAAGSTMSASGSASFAANNLTLNADNAPNQPAIFFYGNTQISIAFGNGFRCVGGTTVRLPAVVGSGGNFSYAVDMIGDGLSVGTHNFQCWYRDPAGGGAFFNLSDGLEVVITP